jgi:hypothetical protein
MRETLKLSAQNLYEVSLKTGISQAELELQLMDARPQIRCFLIETRVISFLEDPPEEKECSGSISSDLS